MSQVTKMEIRVDLGCEKCRKKIKTVLCKIPQIQNQIYDEKSNTVTITVVCCCPEKVKDKICCKAGDIILGIQIIPPQPPAKAPEKPKEKPPEPEKPEQPEKPKEPKVTIVEPPKVDPKPPPSAEPAYPRPIPCCRECYEGRGWGPCYRDHCLPPPCYGRPVYDSWGGGGGRIYVSRCTDYISEENPTAACIIM